MQSSSGQKGSSISARTSSLTLSCRTRRSTASSQPSSAPSRSQGIRTRTLCVPPPEQDRYRGRRALQPRLGRPEGLHAHPRVYAAPDEPQYGLPPARSLGIQQGKGPVARIHRGSQGDCSARHEETHPLPRRGSRRSSGKQGLARRVQGFPRRGSGKEVDLGTGSSRFGGVDLVRV